MQARKILEKKQDAAKKAAVNAERYPGVVPGTTEFDAVAGKFITVVACVDVWGGAFSVHV